MSRAASRTETVHTEFCAVAPSPQLRERMRESLRGDADVPALAREPRRLGFNDGVIRPPSSFPPGTARRAIRHAAADRDPLRGAVRVLVVLIDFPDKGFSGDTGRLKDLFFSTGVVPTGSVTEYY